MNFLVKIWCGTSIVFVKEARVFFDKKKGVSFIN